MVVMSLCDRASVACYRRTGGMHAVESMNHFFFSNEIIVAGRAVSVARDKGDVEKDDEGVQMALTLGQRIAWLLSKVYE